MSQTIPQALFDVSGMTVAVTGGGGVLCRTLAQALADQGVSVAVLDLRKDASEAAAEHIRKSLKLVKCLRKQPMRFPFQRWRSQEAGMKKAARIQHTACPAMNRQDKPC